MKKMALIFAALLAACGGDGTMMDDQGPAGFSSACENCPEAPQSASTTDFSPDGSGVGVATQPVYGGIYEGPGAEYIYGTAMVGWNGDKRCSATVYSAGWVIVDVDCLTFIRERDVNLDGIITLAENADNTTISNAPVGGGHGTRTADTIVKIQGGPVPLGGDIWDATPGLALVHVSEQMNMAQLSPYVYSYQYGGIKLNLYAGASSLLDGTLALQLGYGARTPSEAFPQQFNYWWKELDYYPSSPGVPGPSLSGFVGYPHGIGGVACEGDEGGAVLRWTGTKYEAVGFNERYDWINGCGNIPAQDNQTSIENYRLKIVTIAYWP